MLTDSPGHQNGDTSADNPTASPGDTINKYTGVELVVQVSGRAGVHRGATSSLCTPLWVANGDVSCRSELREWCPWSVTRNVAFRAHS